MAAKHFPSEVKAANEKFRVGDSLTDYEVRMLFMLYNDASKAVELLHIPAYRLVSDDLYKNRNRLEEIKNARGLR